MKRKAMALVLTAAMVMGLTACGGSADTQAGNTDGTQQGTQSGGVETAEAGNAGGGDREVITLFRSDDGNGAIEAAIAGFEASQDQYEVKWVVATNDTDQTKSQLNTAFSAGSSEYDVVSIDTVWAGDMAAAGYIEPLDSYIKDAGHSVTDYNKGSLQAGTYSAKTYALPLYPDFGSLFFRKDVVDEADAAKLVSGDYTFDELIAMAEKYAGQGGTKAGLVFQSNQYEGLICNANEWTSNFTDIKGGLETMKKAVDSSATPDDILVYQEDQSANSFVNGESVFQRNWPYVWGNLGAEGSAVKQEQVDVAPLPGGSCIGGWLLAMNAKSEHKDGAWALLNYLTSEEGQVIFCSKGGYVPGWNAAVDNPDVVKANALLSKEGFVKALDNTIARPSSDHYQEMSDNLQIAIHKYLSGSAELDATAAEVEKLLAQ